MKSSLRLSVLIVVLLSGDLAFSKEAPTASTACKIKVEKLIHDSAKSMGILQKFSIRLTSEKPSLDITKRPLVTYDSSAFTVDEGYISNSGASVTVRPTANSCEIIKLTISVGA